jgi:hypothetical protein
MQIQVPKAFIGLCETVNALHCIAKLFRPERTLTEIGPMIQIADAESAIKPAVGILVQQHEAGAVALHRIAEEEDTSPAKVSIDLVVSIAQF